MPHQCPICFSFLEVKDVAPCWECGIFDEEIAHFHEGRHTYAEVEIWPDLTAVMCNFCMVDFSSYDPDFWEAPRNVDLPFPRELREVQGQIQKGRYCPECNYRQPFLEFIVAAREHNRRIAESRY